jgi:RHS repeat-associated protein
LPENTFDTTGTPGSPAVVLEYDYVDATGRLTDTKAAVEGAYDFHSNYRYDALGRVTQLIQKGTGTPNAATVPEKRVDFQYNALGQRTAVTRYKNVAGTFQVARSAYGYDSANRLTSLTHQRGASTVASYAYEYDANDRITQFNLPNRSSESRAYTYDANGQVVSAGAEAFAYDAQGNRTGDGYGTLSENRIGTSPVDPSAPGGATYAYEYDFEGNITSRHTADAYEYGGQWWPAAVGGETADYSWDHRNRLTEVVVRTLPTEEGPHHQRRFLYTYDADDRRIGKEIQLDEDGDHVYVTESVERYVYDGADLVLVFNGNNGPLKHRYLHGPDVDEPLAEEDASNTTRWMLPDHQGTVRDVVDSSGTGTVHIAYSAFGDVISPIDPLSAPRFGYTGREMDPESGLYFYRARYYDPAIGRFISQDPIGFDGGDANLYRYVSNGPVNATDPSGTLERGQGARVAASSGFVGKRVLPEFDGSGSQDERSFQRAYLSQHGLEPWGPDWSIHPIFDNSYLGGSGQGPKLSDVSTVNLMRDTAFSYASFFASQGDHARASQYLGYHNRWATYMDDRSYGNQWRTGGTTLQSWINTSIYASLNRQFNLDWDTQLQGILNAANGLTNSIVDLANSLSDNNPFIAMPAGSQIDIPRWDWSRGLIVDEYDNVFSHGLSVGAAQVGWELVSSRLVSAPRTYRLPASPAVGAAEGRLLTDAQRFGGIRQASQYLRDMGVSRAKRVEWLQAFEEGTVRFRLAGDAEFGIRYFGGRANPAGSWLFETFPASRGSLALDPKFGNTMAGFRQWQIVPGTPIIEGRAAAQGIYPGGQVQKFILDYKTGLVAP